MSIFISLAIHFIINPNPESILPHSAQTITPQRALRDFPWRTLRGPPFSRKGRKVWHAESAKNNYRVELKIWRIVSIFISLAIHFIINPNSESILTHSAQTITPQRALRDFSLRSLRGSSFHAKGAKLGTQRPQRRDNRL